MATTHPERPAPLDYRPGEPDEPAPRERPLFAMAFTLLAVLLVVAMAVAVVDLIASTSAGPAEPDRPENGGGRAIRVRARREIHMTDHPPKKSNASDPPEPHALHYRPPVPEPKSQWWTDDQPGGGWLVPTLLALTAAGAVISAVIGVAAMFVGC